jgi:hypothetical protein
VPPDQETETTLGWPATTLEGDGETDTLVRTGLTESEIEFEVALAWLESVTTTLTEKIPAVVESRVHVGLELVHPETGLSWLGKIQKKDTYEPEPPAGVAANLALVRPSASIAEVVEDSVTESAVSEGLEDGASNFD